MNFYFCEKCGKRITDVDIDKGLGRNKKLKGVYCTDCSVGVMTMDSLPMMTDAQARKVLAQDVPAAEPARVRVSARHREEGAKSGRHETEPSGRNKAVVYGGLGAVALIAVVMFLVLGRGTPPVAQSKPQPDVPGSSPRPVPPATTPQPAAKPEAPAPAPTRPEARPPETVAVNPEPAPRIGMLEQTSELTPKERYEQALREGRAQPEAAAPAPVPAPAAHPVNPALAPAPPEADPSWRSIFNGTDLTGWSLAKGNCRVENGEMILTANTAGGARIDQQNLYPSFEFTCQLYSDNSKYSEIWVGKGCFPIYFPQKSWRVFRAVVSGDVQATLDGVPVKATASGRTPMLQLYVSNPFTMKIKDVRVRELPLEKPADGTAAGNPAQTPEQPPATSSSEKPPPPPPPPFVAPAEKLLGITTPPLNDPSWKTPLKDKVLEGWTLEKGSGTKEGGEYVLSGANAVGAQMFTEKGYTDVEMIVHLYSEDTQPKQVRVRGSIFEYTPQEKKWQTFHVVAKGGRLEARLDGAPQDSSHGWRCARPSAPLRFTSKGTLRIRDLYLRELP